MLHCGPDLQNFMPRYGCHECDSDTEAISFSEWGLPAALRVCSRRTAARSTATMGLDAAGAAEAEVVGGVAEAPAAGAVEVAQGSAELATCPKAVRLPAAVAAAGDWFSGADLLASR